MYKAVIFDLDGTLLDTSKDLANAGNYVLSQLNLHQHTEAEFKHMIGHGIKNLVTSMLPSTARGGEMEKMALQMFKNYYSLHSADKTEPFEKTHTMIKVLKNAGVKLAVFSNKDNVLANSLVQKHFEHAFDMSLGHIEGMKLKPDPQGLITICKELNVGQNEVLFVGDGEADVLAAKNAGIDMCCALWGYRTKQQLLDVGATLFASTQKQVCEIALASRN